MAFWRRRLIYTGVSVVIMATYISFINIVQQAVITANRVNRVSPPTTSRQQLPSVTGFSLEMQFRTAKNFTCNDQLTKPEPKQIRWSNLIWQRAQNTNLYLFSAHLDQRLTADDKIYPFLRIIAMIENTADSNYFCQTWDNRGKLLFITDASLLEIWFDSWDQRPRIRAYRPYLITCPVISNNSLAFTSVVAHPCDKPTNLLDVNSEIINENERKNFAICVKGLDFPTDIAERFVEWVEINRIFGGEYFVFYVYHVHPNMKTILDYYEKMGVAKVIEITLPGLQPNFVVERSKFLRRNVWQKRRNELVPYNDCFYRNVKGFRYVVPLDVDEVIVPVRHDNWTDLFRELGENDPELLEKYASVSAQQVYFLQSSQTSQDLKRADVGKIPPNFGPILRHTRRAADFAPPGHSVKSFMSSDKCLTVFNHYALEPLNPGIKRDILLPTHLVQLNHYKKECPLSAHKECPLYESRTQLDMVMWRFKDQLMQRVKKVLSNM